MDKNRRCDKRVEEKMTILINKQTKVLIQGITGHQGALHTKIMQEYGTQIVAGVTPGKGGAIIGDISVYNTVKEACKYQNPEWSILFVPREHAKQAACEALTNKLNIIIITEHIPIHDVIAIKQEAKKRDRIMIGPNSPGIICPEEIKIAIMPEQFFRKGSIGVLSRSGTLTYEIVNYLTEANLGQTTVIGIGGDAINGFSFIDGLKLFAEDKETRAIILVGEIGGTAEEEVAEFLKQIKYQEHYKKFIVAYIAGKTAPSGKQMGHAGALVQGTKGTAAGKVAALKSAGVHVVDVQHEIVEKIKKLLKIG